MGGRISRDLCESVVTKRTLPDAFDASWVVVKTLSHMDLNLLAICLATDPLDPNIRAFI
jgi:hypothetical protein